jgi:hypothetical protein
MRCSLISPRNMISITLKYRTSSTSLSLLCPSLYCVSEIDLRSSCDVYCRCDDATGQDKPIVPLERTRTITFRRMA